jgi:hypothetical protein
MRGEINAIDIPKTPLNSIIKIAEGEKAINSILDAIKIREKIANWFCFSLPDILE